MAEKPGCISNPEISELFDILEDWEKILQAQNIDFDELSCPQDDCPEGPQPSDLADVSLGR